MYDFQIIEHTADIKIRAYGQTKEELFLHALQGMFHVLKPESEYCTYEQERLVCSQFPLKHVVVIESVDLDSLLVDFLSHALYLSDVHNAIYLQMSSTQLSDRALQTVIEGVPITKFEVVELKAVTYHDLQIQCINGVWQTDIVFDI